MKTIFLDTNLIIDFLADRRPFSLLAAEIFNFSLTGQLKIYISAVSYNNIYYILRQTLSNNEALRLLNHLGELTEVADVTKDTIKKALKSEFKDFEDAIQYYCALSMSKVELIVTRDSKDFRKSILPVMNPEEALGFIRSPAK